MKRLCCILLCFATTALAETAPAEVFADMALDLNGNGIEEVYTLVRNENGDADLVVTGDPQVQGRYVSLTWAGAMFGTTPTLGYRHNGSLQVISGNDAIGRGRWNQVLTVAWRNDRLTLAGLTYTWFDTLDLQNRGTCDVNLMTGRGVFSQENFGGRDIVETVAIALPLSDWTADSWLDICTPLPTGNP